MDKSHRSQKSQKSLQSQKSNRSPSRAKPGAVATNNSIDKSVRGSVITIDKSHRSADKSLHSTGLPPQRQPTMGAEEGEALAAAAARAPALVATAAVSAAARRVGGPTRQQLQDHSHQQSSMHKNPQSSSFTTINTAELSLTSQRSQTDMQNKRMGSHMATSRVIGKSTF